MFDRSRGYKGSDCVLTETSYPFGGRTSAAHYGADEVFARSFRAFTEARMISSTLRLCRFWRTVELSAVSPEVRAYARERWRRLLVEVKEMKGELCPAKTT